MRENSYGPVLSVDLGGTKIITAVVLPGGQVVSWNYCLTLAKEGPDAIIRRLLAAVSKAATRAKLDINEFAGVSIAAAGALDIKRGLVTDSPNLPHWHNVPLRDILADELNISVYLINDASAAALGEHRFGAGRGVDNLIYLTVSTGIGGGIIIGGKLYSGTNGCAGELGHMTIDVNGPQCSCGNFGCLEILASGTAVAKEALRRLRQGEPSYIIELADGNLENVNAKIVSLAARKGDSLACEIVAETANYLGVGMANMVNIFNPDMIIVGGSVSRMGGILLKPVRKVMKDRAFRLPSRTVRIVRTRLGSHAGIIGAAAYVFEQQSERSIEA